MKRVSLATKMFVVGLLVLTGSILVAKAFLVTLRRHTPENLWVQEVQSGALRLRGILAVLPRIAGSTGPTAIVFGSSQIASDFSPDIFDEQLRQQGVALTTYNISVLGIDPIVQHLLAGRLRAAFEGAGKTAELSIVEFTPYLATTRRKNSPRYAEDNLVKEAIAGSPRQIIMTAPRSPWKAADLASLRLFGYPGTVVVGVLGGILFQEPPEEGNLSQELDLLLQRRFHGPPPEWNEELRGECGVLFPETREVYQKLLQRSREAREQNRQYMIEGNDCIELRFDQEMISEIIATVDEFRRFSKHVVVLLVPRNNAWLPLTAGGQARLTTVLDRIQREEQVPLLDFAMSPQFSDDDFLDTTHLNELTGRSRFSRLLATEIAERWSSQNWK